jgi:hypothetical protein
MPSRIPSSIHARESPIRTPTTQKPIAKHSHGSKKNNTKPNPMAMAPVPN